MHNDKEKFILDCPAFLYKYSPDGTARDTRYVFKDETFIADMDYSAQRKAYKYAVDMFDKMLMEKAKEELSYQHGIPAIEEMRDISWVYGPEVKSRHYRITFEDERVSDYRVLWDDDFTEILSAEEYNVVI